MRDTTRGRYQLNAAHPPSQKLDILGVGTKVFMVIYNYISFKRQEDQRLI